MTYSTSATLPHLLFWSCITRCSKATLIVPVPNTPISHRKCPVSNPEQSICTYGGQKVRVLQWWPQYHLQKKKWLARAVKGESKLYLAPCPFSPRTGNASSHPFPSSSKRNFIMNNTKEYSSAVNRPRNSLVSVTHFVWQVHWLYIKHRNLHESISLWVHYCWCLMLTVKQNPKRVFSSKIPRKRECKNNICFLNAVLIFIYLFILFLVIFPFQNFLLCFVM
jgi:hypothetical protein